MFRTIVHVLLLFVFGIVRDVLLKGLIVLEGFNVWCEPKGLSCSSCGLGLQSIPPQMSMPRPRCVPRPRSSFSSSDSSGAVGPPQQQGDEGARDHRTSRMTLG